MQTSQSHEQHEPLWLCSIMVCSLTLRHLPNRSFEFSLASGPPQYLLDSRSTRFWRAKCVQRHLPAGLAFAPSVISVQMTRFSISSICPFADTQTAGHMAILHGHERHWHVAQACARAFPSPRKTQGPRPLPNSAKNSKTRAATRNT